MGASGMVGWDIELGNSVFKNSRGEGELREGNIKGLRPPSRLYTPYRIQPVPGTRSNVRARIPIGRRQPLVDSTVRMLGQPGFGYFGYQYFLGAIFHE